MKRTSHAFESSFWTRSFAKVCLDTWRSLASSPGNIYPDVLTNIEKHQRLEENWQYRIEILQGAFDDRGRRRICWDRENVQILSAVELQLGKTTSSKFKQECVEMTVKGRKKKPRCRIPDWFEIISFWVICGLERNKKIVMVVFARKKRSQCKPQNKFA